MPQAWAESRCRQAVSTVASGRPRSRRKESEEYQHDRPEQATWKHGRCPGGPGRLPAPGSHSPVRARISAYGSSDHGFASRFPAHRVDRHRRRQTDIVSSRRLKQSQVIDRSRLRRDNQYRQIRWTCMRNTDSSELLPVIP